MGNSVGLTMQRAAGNRLLFSVSLRQKSFSLRVNIQKFKNIKKTFEMENSSKGLELN